jgi:hypothetical protein
MPPSNEVVNGNDESQDSQDKKKEKKHNSGAADLEKVTDFAEETELKDIANVIF